MIVCWGYAFMLERQSFHMLNKIQSWLTGAGGNVAIKYHKAEEGTILIAFVLIIPVLMGAIGMGVDVGTWLSSQRNLQTAADAAALAGAHEIANGRSESQAETSALAAAQANGYTGAALVPVFGTDSSGNVTVTVNLSETAPLYFTNQLLTTPITISTSAMAGLQPGGSGPYCALTLSKTASDSVLMNGSLTVDTPNCGIAVNSDAATAWLMNGSLSVNVGAVNLVGGYSTNGSVTFDHTSLTTDGSAVADPYASLDPPSGLATCTSNPCGGDVECACTAAQQSAGCAVINGSGSHTMLPGTYCGGQSINGSWTITMDPGTYIMDGGSFSNNGSSTINGTGGVTIIMTNSGGASYGTYGSFDVNGSGAVNLTAPTTGDYAGIAVFQDRNAPTNSVPDTINGSAGVNITGAIYVPSETLTYNGSESGTPSDCTQLIANELVMNGSSNFGNSCSDVGTKPIGAIPTVILEQ